MFFESRGRWCWKCAPFADNLLLRCWCQLFPSAVLMECYIPQRESGKSLHFTLVLISCTITTQSAATGTEISILRSRPQTQSWADIKVLQRAVRVCSAVAIWQLASQTLFERVKHYTAARLSIIASHLQLFPRGAALHEGWRHQESFGLL